jgi:hypothetical protein
MWLLVSAADAEGNSRRQVTAAPDGLLIAATTAQQAGMPGLVQAAD